MVTHWLRMFPRLVQIFVVLTAINCMAVELQKPVERNPHTIQSSAFGILRCFDQLRCNGTEDRDRSLHRKAPTTRDFLPTTLTSICLTKSTAPTALAAFKFSVRGNMPCVCGRNPIG